MTPIYTLYEIEIAYLKRIFLSKYVRCTAKQKMAHHRRMKKTRKEEGEKSLHELDGEPMISVYNPL